MFSTTGSPGVDHDGAGGHVSPDTRSRVGLRLGVASVVHLGPRFAGHHDRKFPTGKLSNQLPWRGNTTRVALV